MTRKKNEQEVLKNESSLREIMEKYDNEFINHHESMEELRATAKFNIYANE